MELNSRVATFRLHNISYYVVFWNGKYWKKIRLLSSKIDKLDRNDQRKTKFYYMLKIYSLCILYYLHSQINSFRWFTKFIEVRKVCVHAWHLHHESFHIHRSLWFLLELNIFAFFQSSHHAYLPYIARSVTVFDWYLNLALQIDTHSIWVAENHLTLCKYLQMLYTLKLNWIIINYFVYMSFFRIFLRIKVNFRNGNLYFILRFITWSAFCKYFFIIYIYKSFEDKINSYQFDINSTNDHDLDLEIWPFHNHQSFLF